MTDPIAFPAESPRVAVLALVAHDEKKDDLLRLARQYRRTLARLHLIATGHTGLQLSTELDLPVERMHTGPEGGDIQIGARIVEGRVDAVVFLRDPLTAHPHEPDIQALLKICDIHGVPSRRTSPRPRSCSGRCRKRSGGDAVQPRRSRRATQRSAPPKLGSPFPGGRRPGLHESVLWE